MAFGGVLLSVAGPVQADWKDQIGFTRLQLLAGSELPNAPLQGFTQVEALEIAANYLPNTTSPNFAGKTFTVKSGASGVSSHANLVASYFYGNSTSLLTGNIPVDNYSAGSWLGGAFLRVGYSIAPAVESHAVVNHSWIAPTYSLATETNQRLDFAIDRDGFVCVVGENNSTTTTTTVLPELLGQGYHTISVGLTSGFHSAGFTTLDTIGRIKPDIVAPESATSFSTPMVSSAAGLLYSKLSSTPYSLSGADLPRVIKALLLASARKDTVAGSWGNTSVRPLDLRFGAGELNINHAYHDLRAGRGSASISTLQKARGWSAESVNANATKSYYFTIPAGTSPTPFCAAMTWHRIVTDNIPGSNWGNLTTSMADLDLHLYHASGFIQGALVSESTGYLNNVELVYQPTLSPGDYVIVVENTSATATPFALAWHSLPSVGIVATNPIARELDLQQGTFTITRSGDATLPLYVPLSIGGTAISGTHFQALPSSVTIPAGLASISFQVTPIADNLAQGSRSLTVGIASDFALVSNPAQFATVTIEDKPFDAWRFAKFDAVELTDPIISGANADPDADQLSNLIEYAMNLDPKAFSPTTAMVDQNRGYLTITLEKNTTATDISWSAEVTSDLTNWTPAVVITNTDSSFQARDSILASTAPKRMIRLKITRP